MTKRLHSDSRIQSIYDAISEKTGDTTPMTTAGMATAISEMSDGASDLLLLTENNGGGNRLDLSDENFKTTATSIRSQTFRGCYISSLTLSSIETIESYAFYESRILALSLPNCKTIGDYAFYHMNYYEGSVLTQFSFPKVETIGSTAFEDARINTGVLNFPECKIVKSYGLASLPSVTSFNFPKCETFEEGAFNFTHINIDITLPKVKTIAFKAFRHFRGTNFTIGPDCTSIAAGMLDYNGKITNLYVQATTPPTLGGSFGGDGVSHIYVPADSVAAYKAASNWSNYASIIEAIPS